MTPSSPQHEPTMEEILASIRKIISEDSPETPAEPKQDNDVLELTQEVTEEPVAAASSPSTPSVPEHEPATASARPESAAEPVHAQAAPEPAHQHENDIVFVSHEETKLSGPAESSDHDSIFSDKSRQAIDAAFAGLDEEDEEEAPAAEQATHAAAPSAEMARGSSVEAVFERAVRGSIDPVLHQWMDSHKDDLLQAVKPLIRDWMDEHFPALLEGAVRDEVARVVKARGRR